MVCVAQGVQISVSDVYIEAECIILIHDFCIDECALLTGLISWS